MNATVKKGWLLDRLATNRTAHRGLFEKALDGFYKTTLRRFEKNIELIRKNKMPETSFLIAIPQDKTEEYDRAIEMVKANIEENIELSEADYIHLVLDKWAWSQAVNYTNSTYASGSTPEA